MNQQTVVLTRVFDAPLQKVFDCWTRAEHLVHWFGPKGFTIHSCTTDPRAGGVFRLCMRSPQGKDYWVRGEFREVAAPARLVITCTAEDERGVAQLQETIDVAFSEDRGRTRVALNATARGPSETAAAMLEGMEVGWAQTIDRLGTLLKVK